MILDSSVLLEVLLSQPLKQVCLKEIKSKKAFISSLAFYECFKVLRSKLSDGEAMEAISALQTFPHLDVTPSVALTAADLAVQFKIAMADGIMLAHARITNKELLTLDNDFASIPGVRVLKSD